MLNYHYQACKLLVFQNTHNNFSTTLTLQVQNTQQSVDLTPLATFLGQWFLDPCHYNCQVYDPETLKYQLVPANLKLPVKYFTSPIVLFKYLRSLDGSARVLSLLAGQTKDQQTSQVQKALAERPKQRTIGEVIKYVKLWRESCIKNEVSASNQEVSQLGPKKLKLKDAAKNLGVARKSLDDYYCQLRLAERKGFNFRDNLNKGFGVVRAFVKNQYRQTPNNKEVVGSEQARPTVKKHKHTRYPKTLMVLKDQEIDTLIAPVPLAPVHIKSTDDRVLIEELQMMGALSELNSFHNLSDLAHFVNTNQSRPYLSRQQSLGAEKQEQAPLVEQESSGGHDSAFCRVFEQMLRQPKDPFVTYSARDYKQYHKKQETNDLDAMMMW